MWVEWYPWKQLLTRGPLSRLLAGLPCLQEGLRLPAAYWDLEASQSTYHDWSPRPTHNLLCRLRKPGLHSEPGTRSGGAWRWHSQSGSNLEAVMARKSYRITRAK